jgi:hypothetical protein
MSGAYFHQPVEPMDIIGPPPLIGHLPPPIAPVSVPFVPQPFIPPPPDEEYHISNPGSVQGGQWSPGSPPGDHPLEDAPYMLFRGPGIGHLGGDGPLPSVDNGESWAACARAVREYDEKLIQSWRSDMDTTLVFVSHAH